MVIGFSLILGWSIIEYVIFCNIIWWLFYWFLIIVSRQSEEWCCRLLTFFHGCVVSYSAMRDILMNKQELDFQNVPLTEVQKSYLSFMLSYFIFDFFWIHFFGNEAWIIYFHHITSILIIIKIMISDFGGIGISYGVAGLEFTNPYLQLRWFLRTHGYLNTSLHTGLEIWFFTLFFIIRIIGGTILFYYVEKCAQTDIIMKLSLSSVYVVSLILAWQIFSYIKKKYFIAGRGVALMTSRISISPYFQRRTLDPDNQNNVPDTTALASESWEAEPSSPKLKIEPEELSSLTTEAEPKPIKSEVAGDKNDNENEENKSEENVVPNED